MRVAVEVGQWNLSRTKSSGVSQGEIASGLGIVPDALPLLFGHRHCLEGGRMMRALLDAVGNDTSGLSPFMRNDELRQRLCSVQANNPGATISKLIAACEGMRASYKIPGDPVVPGCAEPAAGASCLHEQARNKALTEHNAVSEKLHYANADLAILGRCKAYLVRLEEYFVALSRAGNASGIRWVQIARAAQSVSEGFRVLSDTRSEEICYTGGQYRLGQELEAAGTVPEYAHGKRKCSIKSKGDPLDAWIAQELGAQPFRHFLGFNAEEEKRVTRDLSYSSVERQSEYPLLDWGWTRERTQEYLQSVFHIVWPKSCCSFCPFASGKAELLRRYRIFPREAAEAVMLEYVSMALNPRMSLYSGCSLLSSIRADGNTRVLELFGEMLNGDAWAVYRVRRIYFNNSCWRKTEIVARGTREEVSAVIYFFGEGELNTVTEHLRVMVREKEQGKEFPREEFFVASPARVIEKSRPSFDEKWAQVDESEKQLHLAFI